MQLREGFENDSVDPDSFDLGACGIVQWFFVVVLYTNDSEVYTTALL